MTSALASGPFLCAQPGNTSVPTAPHKQRRSRGKVVNQHQLMQLAERTCEIDLKQTHLLRLGTLVRCPTGSRCLSQMLDSGQLHRGCRAESRQQGHPQLPGAHLPIDRKGEPIDSTTHACGRCSCCPPPSHTQVDTKACSLVPAAHTHAQKRAPHLPPLAFTFCDAWALFVAGDFRSAPNLNPQQLWQQRY